MNTADYAFSTAGVYVNLTSGTGSGGDAQGDTLVNIQNVSGTQYADTLVGNSQANTLLGGDGNDVIYAEGSGDHLDGGNGVDWVVFYDSTAGVTVDLATGAGSGGFAQGDAILNFENLEGSNFADNLSGTSDANIIYGFGGNDVINAQAGADTVYAGDGDDRVVDNDFVNFDYYDGGAGNDTIDYSQITFADGVVTINLSTGQTSVTGGNTETILNFENVVGSQGGETIIGNAGANVIDGSGGADVMQGLGGNDTYYVDNAGDVVDEAAGGGSDRVLTSVSYTLTAGQEIEIAQHDEQRRDRRDQPHRQRLRADDHRQRRRQRHRRRRRRRRHAGAWRQRHLLCRQCRRQS